MVWRRGPAVDGVAAFRVLFPPGGGLPRSAGTGCRAATCESAHMTVRAESAAVSGPAIAGLMVMILPFC